MTVKKGLSFKEKQWYEKSASYWTGVDASVNGMLGGLGYLHENDIKASKYFLEFLLPVEKSQSCVVCDCGAGIGRISTALLSQNFSSVDLVESNERFLKQAKEELSKIGKVGETFCCGLEKFEPPLNKYKVIWVQWVVNYLKDEDLVAFICRCLNALQEGGFLILKENVTRQNDYEWDEEDCSVTRSDDVFKQIFNKAGGAVVKEVLQPGFPQKLYPVKMWALQVKSTQK